MWRGALLVVGLFVCALLFVSCGGGGGDSARSPACPMDRTHPPSGQQTLPNVSLEEARKRTQFDLAVPQNLPLGVRVARVLLHPDPNCPDQRIRIAELYFAGTYQFTIMESDGELSVGGHVDPVRVGSHRGNIERRNSGASVSVQWSDKRRSYSAIAGLSGQLTEERFLQILGSIPE